jgi:type I restriction enzyme S subunit
MNIEKKLIPLLRFPEYTYANSFWLENNVGDSIKTLSPPKKLQSNDYKRSGKYPIIDQSQGFICGYSDDNSAVINKNSKELIVFGDHTCVLKFIDFPFIQGADGIKIFEPKSAAEIDVRYLYQYLVSSQIESKEYKRHFSELKEKIFLYPKTIKEQTKIADCLFAIDTYISFTNEKVEQLKAHKKSLMQKLFPQRGQTVPEYRFSEFQKDSAWEKMKLGDVTTVINRRNKSSRSLPIYSISNKDGFVLQSEQFDGLDSESRGYDISLYKIVGRNTFAYNPARINIGSIGYSGNLKEVLISSLYVCFKTTDELDDEFLQCFLKTAEFNQAVENNVEGGIRSYLFYENFSRIRIALPSLQEQKKIATTILSIDDVISKYTNKVSLLNDYKKGLMQQLFPTITK